MGDHIDFIENIYSNVKKPLGFVCSKLQLLIRNDDQNYSLTENRILDSWTFKRLNLYYIVRVVSSRIIIYYHLLYNDNKYE